MVAAVLGGAFVEVSAALLGARVSVFCAAAVLAGGMLGVGERLNLGYNFGGGQGAVGGQLLR